MRVWQVDGTPKPKVLCQSALVPIDEEIDVIVTDPPYYDAIPYSDLMDFFSCLVAKINRRNQSGIRWSFLQNLSVPNGIMIPVTAN